MGLRPVHYSAIFAQWPNVDWLEIVSENFMDSDGKPRRNLEQILTRYPVVMHGVSLSIGGTGPLDLNYLRTLKALADFVNPPFLSDHLCWTGNAHSNTHDLLPVPYTEEALQHIVARIRQVQNMLERPLVLENPSTYLQFKASEMPEWEFLSRMAVEADCGLLLDANNVYVTCMNHRLDAKTYLDAIPADRVVYVHLAGHENKGTHLVDTHEGTIIEAVWDVYRYILGRTGPVSTMVEWDTNIPEFPVVYEQVQKAREVGQETTIPNRLAPQHASREETPDKSRRYGTLLETMQQSILPMEKTSLAPGEWIRDKPRFPPREQLGVYINGYRYRLFDVCHEDFPVLRHYLGNTAFNRLLDDYICHHISRSYTIAHYGLKLPEHIEKAFLPKKINRGFAKELATLEATIALIFDLPETAALSPDALRGMNEEAFMAMRLLPRTALRLHCFSYPMNDYYSAVKEKLNTPRLGKKTTYLAVYRDDDRIWRLVLEQEEHRMLEILLKGKTVGETLETLIAQRGGKAKILAPKIQHWFSRWMSHHLLSRVSG